jgi:hypothetical protein
LYFSFCVEEIKEDNIAPLDELVVGEGDAKAETIVGFVRMAINNIFMTNKVGNLLERWFRNIYL